MKQAKLNLKVLLSILLATPFTTGAMHPEELERKWQDCSRRCPVFDDRCEKNCDKKYKYALKKIKIELKIRNKAETKKEDSYCSPLE